MQRDFYKRRADDLTRFMAMHQEGCCVHIPPVFHNDAETKCHRYRSPLSSSHPSITVPVKTISGRRAITPPPRLGPNQKLKNFKSRSLSPKGRSVTICHKAPAKEFPKHKQETRKICPVVMDQELKQIKEERDYYERQYEKLKSERFQRNLSPPVKEKDVYCSQENQKLYQEKIDLQKTCLKLEDQVNELQKRIKEVFDEKKDLQRQHAEAECKIKHMEHERSIGKTLAERSMIRSLERENEQLSQDCKNAILERDVLRDKLKLATDTQIAERKRLENTVMLLEKKLKEKENEYSELCAEKNNYKKQITHLQEQIYQLQHEVAAANDNTIHQQAVSNQMQKLAEQTQKYLEEAEHKLAVKEASGIETYMKKMEEEINELTLKNMQQKSDMESLRRTITVIDQEKDQLQADIDVKSERLASLENSMKQKDRTIKDLKVTINTLETTLKRQQEENFTYEKKLTSLQRQLDSLETERQSIASLRDNHVHQIQVLKDDLATLTRENQRLHNELDKASDEEKHLKKQIQNYINDVSKIESLLKLKEQERVDLFAQFRNVADEATTLESQNNQLESETATIRLELHSKNVEIQHLQNVLANLQQEVEQYIAAQQNLELELTETRHIMKSLEEERHKYHQEKDDLQKDATSLRALCSKLDSRNEILVRQLANKEEECNELQKKLNSVESQLTRAQEEAEDRGNQVCELEKLVTANRTKEFDTHLSIQEMRTELQQAQEQLREAENHLISMSEECSNYHSKVNALQLEIDQLRHQLTNEKFEKERINQEYRKLKFGLSSSPDRMSTFGRQRTVSPIPSDRSDLDDLYTVDRHSYRYAYGTSRLYSGKDVLHTQDRDKFLTDKPLEDNLETIGDEAGSREIRKNLESASPVIRTDDQGDEISKNNYERQFHLSTEDITPPAAVEKNV